MELDATLTKAILAIIPIYGEVYLKPRIHSCGLGKHENDTTVRYFFLFEGKERKDLQPNSNGWTVYATVDVDKKTNHATVMECILPDGTNVT